MQSRPRTPLIHALRLLGIATIALLIGACGGGGGAGSEAAVTAERASSGAADAGLADTAPQPVPYTEAEQIVPYITSVTVPADGQPVVDFQLTNENSVAILDLGPGDVRFAIAKLRASPLGNLAGDWQSYVNQVEEPGVGTGTEAKLQATAERATSGTLTNNGDGTYSYRFALNITAIDDAEILAQAASEGLDLGYEPDRTHRVAMQFANSKLPSNPDYDWIPATGETVQVQHADIVATENCNGCHQQLALHGGGRIEMRYCVTCHNPGSTDANSGNSVDFKVLVHKLHMGRNLPSVQAGGEYAIYGFRNSKHDYSDLGFPQDIRNCQLCHGGSSSGNELTAQLTTAGDNWTQFASEAACGSCHDDVDFTRHFGDQSGDENCMSCHQTAGIAGNIAESHRNLVAEAGQAFAGRIHSVTNTQPGEFPTIQYSVVDPTNGDAPYDLLGDPAWTQGGGASRLAIDLAWSSSDFHNTGNDSEDASAVSINALEGTAVGDGTFTVVSPVAIPDGSEAPGIAATGSGAVALEGHPAIDFGSAAESNVQRIAFPGEVAYFSIDEASGTASARRDVADLDKCLTCHGQLSLHGNNRTDNLPLCATCHNPRNTDHEVRTIAANPPSDGKDEETLDFKVMVHAIHAAAMRENPLQIVGFRGFSTHVYDEEEVHYPGELGNCLACHDSDTYTLPLASNVLATTIDTGSDVESPADDVVVSATASVCSSCHDGESAQAHMEQNGASFSTTQAAIDDGSVIEQCDLCHGSGRTVDVNLVHPIHSP